MNIKEKLEDFWDDIVWYCTSYPKKIYKDIRHWYYTCAVYLDHWKNVNYNMFHCFPWDNSYFLKSQYYWIKKSLSYFENNPWCSEDKTEEIIRYQKICLGLLEIMLDIRDFWDYDCDNHNVKMKVYYNIKNKHRFPYRGISIDGKSSMTTQMYDHNPDEFYKAKAKYLYYKILRDYSENWWD